jgi:callose synthase
MAASRAVSVYNILPVDNPKMFDHAGMMFPEVKAAIAALQKLPVPPDQRTWDDESDMLDWLGRFFGFQADNVRNQREHLVLLLANGLMHLFPEPSPEPTSFNIPLEANVVKRIRKKVTGNYAKWCRFIGVNNNMQ